eukprot:TRINITY_DN15954_c0_g1_i2.p1 TRINITY_DN15954_c0_g1~~TRINITY_DN15954_c0_g1_i2.p1  ORF type:complete len:784 (-),score=133.09 TRINITY_DN15954_c0_g1_i2:48-2399(-)
MSTPYALQRRHSQCSSLPCDQDEYDEVQDFLFSTFTHGISPNEAPPKMPTLLESRAATIPGKESDGPGKGAQATACRPSDELVIRAGAMPANSPLVASEKSSLECEEQRHQFPTKPTQPRLAEGYPSRSGRRPCAGRDRVRDAQTLKASLDLAMEATLKDGSINIYGGFDPFALASETQNKPLQAVGYKLLCTTYNVDGLCFCKEKLKRFLSSVESRYGSCTEIPYHNSVHAADVTQSVHALMCDIGFGAFFNDTNKVALLLSAIIHDMGHIGRTNAFHIAMLDEISLTYNDQSVLENFHVSEAFRLMLRTPGMDILSGLAKQQAEQVRKEMISCVLATDMALHMSKVSELKTLLDRLGPQPECWISDANNASQQLQAMILHAADISSSTKNSSLADEFAKRLKQEFFEQGDEERSLGLPVSPLCNREKTKFAATQVGFLQFIMQPTIALLAQIVPQVNARLLLRLTENIQLWEDRKTLDLESDMMLQQVAAIKGVKSIDKLLGKGGFSNVFACHMEGIITRIALKVIVSRMQVDRDSREVKVMADLRHPNIVQFFSFIDEIPEVHPAALVLELCTGGTLEKAVHETLAQPRQAFGESAATSHSQRLHMVMDVATAVAFLHGRNIVHRDVKPSNAYLLVPWSLEQPSVRPIVKLGDMGLARAIDDGGLMTAGAGTPAYMAPEVMMETCYGLPSDVFSVAIVAHEVLSGVRPYSSQIKLRDPRALLHIMNGMRPDMRLLPESSMKKEICDILEESWCPAAESRLTADSMTERLKSMMCRLLYRA